MWCGPTCSIRMVHYLILFSTIRYFNRSELTGDSSMDVLLVSPKGLLPQHDGKAGLSQQVERTVQIP